MKVKTWIKYMEGFLPTKRSRKLRFRECEEYLDIELKEVSINEVKKAYQVEDSIYYSYNNDLYIEAKGNDISAFNIENPIENLKYCNEHCSSYFGFKEEDTREKMIDKAKNEIKNYLVIDGKLFIKTFKPFYRVYTFGLGRNHGGIGTSLSVCNRYYDYYKDEDFIFEADARERAIKYALNTAINRGDTNSIEHIKNTPIIIKY